MWFLTSELTKLGCMPYPCFLSAIFKLKTIKWATNCKVFRYRITIFYSSHDGNSCVETVVHVQIYMVVRWKNTQISDCSLWCQWRGGLWDPLLTRVVNSGLSVATVVVFAVGFGGGPWPLNQQFKFQINEKCQHIMYLYVPNYFFQQLLRWIRRRTAR